MRFDNGAADGEDIMALKIEYLENGSEDCPLIRIYGRDPAAVCKLKTAMERLRDGVEQSIEAGKLEGFESAGDISLTMRVSAGSEGLKQIGRRFEWFLEAGSWGAAAALLEPFLERQEFHSHQWLCGAQATSGLNAGHISVLLSASGGW